MLTWPVTGPGKSFVEASPDFRFAAAVASFGLLLRDSQFKGDLTYDDVLEIADQSQGKDDLGYRGEFIVMVKRARMLSLP